MNDLIAQYLKALEVTNKSPQTIKTYRLDIEAFQAWCSRTKKHPLEISVPDFTEYLEACSLLQPSSVKRKVSSLKCFYEYLVAVGAMEKCPVHPIIHAVRIKQVDINSYPMATLEDFDAMIQSCITPGETLACCLIYYCGMRVSELCSIKLAGCDSKASTIRITRKNGKVQALPIPKSDSELIFDLIWEVKLNREEISPYLFASRKGANLRPDSMSRILSEIIAKSACPTAGIAPHSFRRACARRLYLQTKDLLFVRDFLGHSDASVTQRYIGSTL